MKNVITLLTILSVNVLINAQDFNLRHIKTEAEKFPYMISSIQVYDSFDEPMTDLNDKNFFISVDGESCDSLKVFTYKESGLGFNIMLCLDLSGTMRGKPLETMKSAILKFIDDMRTVDKLGFIAYADDAVLISDFSNNKDYLKDKIKNMKVSGTQTALYYGAYKGLRNLIDNKEKLGKILLLMGDGKNESLSSSYKEDDIIELAKKESIPVFTIGYSKIDKSYLQSFERISEKTGGNFYNSPNDDELQKQYAKLYRQILNIYLLNYLITGMSGDGLEHNIAITINYNNAKRTVSNKFIAPAGVRPISKQTKTLMKEIPTWYYFAGGGGILILALAITLFIIRGKRKKVEAERLLAEEKKKQNEQLEIEKKKRFEVEKQLEEKNKVDQDKISPITDSNKLPSDKTHIPPSRREERTMILQPGDQNIANAKNLRIDILVGPNQGLRFEVTMNGATIGRKQNNSIVLNEETVSGNHARIIYNNGSFIMEDLASSNGTFINGKQIKQCQLKHGDVFKFGKCEGQITIF